MPSDPSSKLSSLPKMPNSISACMGTIVSPVVKINEAHVWEGTMVTMSRWGTQLSELKLSSWMPSSWRRTPTLITSMNDVRSRTRFVIQSNCSRLRKRPRSEPPKPLSPSGKAWAARKARVATIILTTMLLAVNRFTIPTWRCKVRQANQVELLQATSESDNSHHRIKWEINRKWSEGTNEFERIRLKQLLYFKAR